MFIKSLFLLVSIYVVDGEPDKDSVKIYEQYLTEHTCLHMATHLQAIFKRPEIVAELDKLDVTEVGVMCIEKSFEDEYVGL